MPDRPNDVRKKLDDMYRKTEELRHNLIEIHHMLTNSGFFADTQNYVKPQPVYVAPPPPPVAEHVVPPVETSYPQPVYTPPAAKTKRESPKAESRPGYFQRNPDIEKFIGERLVTFIGIAILVTGIAFFVKYAIDKDWINEIGRTAIGILCGGILIGFAHRLRKSYTTFSSVLAGGGISVLYFTISYAFQVYQLFSQPVALGLLVVVTIFTVLLSVAYNRRELAILAVIGGFASPLMIKTGDGNFVVLCTYMLILNVGMMTLAYFKKWNIVNTLSFALTILFYTVSLNKDIISHPHVHDREAFLFATLYYIVFFSMNIVNNLKLRRKFKSFEIITLLTNSGLYYGAGYFLLNHMQMQHFVGLFTLIVAAFNTAFAFALFRRQEVDRNLVYFLIGIAITFISLAGPVQLEGNHITLFWAAEAVLLLWFFRKSKLTVIGTFSVIVNVILVLSVLYNWMNVYLIDGTDSSLMVNKGLITTIGSVVSLVMSAWLLVKSNEDHLTGWMKVAYRKTISVTAVAMLYMGGFLELDHQLIRAGFGWSAVMIFCAAYTALFLLCCWHTIRYLSMDFFRWTLRVIAIALLVVTVFFPHFAIIAARNAWLNGIDNMFTAFIFHYVYVIALIVTAATLLRDAVKNVDFGAGYRNFILWLTCIVAVFTLSAEFDHTMVMSYAYNPENPLWRAEKVQSTIDAGLNMSHKVGFPIIWGISSFVMMAAGMRLKNRQLRIISLLLFFGTVVKLVLLGVYGESQTGKIIAFILCGVILLLVSFMYQKLKKFVMDDSQSNSTTNEEVA